MIGHVSLEAVHTHTHTLCRLENNSAKALLLNMEKNYGYF